MATKRIRLNHNRIAAELIERLEMEKNKTIEASNKGVKFSHLLYEVNVFQRNFSDLSTDELHDIHVNVRNSGNNWFEGNWLYDYDLDKYIDLDEFERRVYRVHDKLLTRFGNTDIFPADMDYRFEYHFYRFWITIWFRM